MTCSLRPVALVLLIAAGLPTLSVAANASPEFTPVKDLPFANIVPRQGPPLRFAMQRGPLADYGASPWYTTDLSVGGINPRLALDNGADFTWITSDQCTTPACNAHRKINTAPPFVWLDKNTTARSFGTWGTMYTWTGRDTFYDLGLPLLTMPFFASVNYTGNQFTYLGWDGGIGFPSNTPSVTPGSGFFFGQLWNAGRLATPRFAMNFNAVTGAGQVLLGGDDPTQFDASTEVLLRPASAPGLADTWGTRLNSAALGNTEHPELSRILFWLDSGSSRFKGDGPYVTPLLTQLYKTPDSFGRPIFTKVYDGGVWTGLQYTIGGPDSYPMLPNFKLRLGDSCGRIAGQEVELTLTPRQYSYYVQTGERAGTWMIAIHRLDGIGGLLVGSTLLDLIYSNYTYTPQAGQLVQGDMRIYQKVSSGPTLSFPCRVNPRVLPLH